MDINAIFEALFRWLHIIAGVMWIGLLYFFNFINGHVAATYNADSKKSVVPELMPRTLYWFRWGAAWTWFTGILLLVLVFWLNDGMNTFEGSAEPYGAVGDEFQQSGINYNEWTNNEALCIKNNGKFVEDTGLCMESSEESNESASDDKEKTNPFKHIGYLIPFLMVFVYDYFYKCNCVKNVRISTIISYLGILGILLFLHCVVGMGYRGYNIHIGAMFGSMMAYNVWFRIWPAQQQIINAIKNGEAPDADLVATAGLRSKHNTYLSVPLIWTMINAHTVYVSTPIHNFIKKFCNCEGADYNWVILMLVIAVGWHLVFQLYKKSGKIKGF